MKRSSKTSKQTLTKLRADSKNGLVDTETFSALVRKYFSPSYAFLEKRLKLLGDALLPNLSTYARYVSESYALYTFQF